MFLRALLFRTIEVNKKLELTCVIRLPNGKKLALKFELDQSQRMSSQVNASARNSWPNDVASRRKLETGVYWLYSVLGNKEGIVIYNLILF